MDLYRNSIRGKEQYSSIVELGCSFSILELTEGQFNFIMRKNIV